MFCLSIYDLWPCLRIHINFSAGSWYATGGWRSTNVENAVLHMSIYTKNSSKRACRLTSWSQTNDWKISILYAFRFKHPSLECESVLASCRSDRSSFGSPYQEKWKRKPLIFRGWNVKFFVYFAEIIPCNAEKYRKFAIRLAILSKLCYTN